MTVKLVRDLMHIGVATCRAETKLVEAVRILLREGLEALVVLDETGHAVGLFGRAEAVAAYGISGATMQGHAELTVAEAMRPDIPQIAADIPAAAAAQIMLDQNIRALYLLHQDQGISWPAAVFRCEDVLRYLAGEAEHAPGPASLQHRPTASRPGD